MHLVDLHAPTSRWSLQSNPDLCSLAATQTKRTAVSDLCHCATGADRNSFVKTCYINPLLLLFLDCRRRHVGRGMGLPKQTVYWRIRRFKTTCCVNRLFTYLMAYRSAVQASRSRPARGRYQDGQCDRQCENITEYRAAGHAVHILEA